MSRLDMAKLGRGSSSYDIINKKENGASIYERKNELKPYTRMNELGKGLRTDSLE